MGALTEKKHILSSTGGIGFLSRKWVDDRNLDETRRPADDRKTVPAQVQPFHQLKIHKASSKFGTSADPRIPKSDSVREPVCSHPLERDVRTSHLTVAVSG